MSPSHCSISVRHSLYSLFQLSLKSWKMQCIVFSLHVCFVEMHCLLPDLTKFFSHFFKLLLQYLSFSPFPMIFAEVTMSFPLIIFPFILLSTAQEQMVLFCHCSICHINNKSRTNITVCIKNISKPNLLY